MSHVQRTSKYTKLAKLPDKNADFVVQACGRALLPLADRIETILFLNSGRRTGMTKRILDVLVPVALDHAYSYRAPDNVTLAPGDLVTVRSARANAPGSSGASRKRPISGSITG